jgi:hypothetical protein
MDEKKTAFKLAKKRKTTKTNNSILVSKKKQKTIIPKNSNI